MMRIGVFVMMLAAAVASAKSYTVNLYEPVVFGSVELAPGEYKVDVNGEKAVIRNGKIHGEAAVKVEEGRDRFNTTTVRIENSNGKKRIQEIRLGGTKTRLVIAM